MQTTSRSLWWSSLLVVRETLLSSSTNKNFALKISSIWLVCIWALIYIVMFVSNFNCCCYCYCYAWIYSRFRHWWLVNLCQNLAGQEILVSFFVVVFHIFIVGFTFAFAFKYVTSIAAPLYSQEANYPLSIYSERSR